MPKKPEITLTLSEADRVIGAVWRRERKEDETFHAALRLRNITLGTFRLLVRAALKAEVSFPRRVGLAPIGSPGRNRRR